MSICPTCRQHERVFPTGAGETYRLHVICGTCGEYEIAPGLCEFLQYLDSGDKEDLAQLPYLSAHVRQATDAGALVLLTRDNWRELALSHRSTPVQVKAQKLLQYIAGKTNVGDLLYLQNERRISAAADMRDSNELKFFLDHLQVSGLAEYGAFPAPPDQRNADGSYNAPMNAVRLTVQGWNAAAPIVGGVPGTCFVAMAFRDELKEAYEQGIAPAIERDCKLRVVRIDRIPHNDNITNRIIAAIRSAQIIVADFTLQNAGVYYEAGFAEGLGRTVIRTCRADEFKNLHFDVQQIFFVRWADPADLRTRLAEHIQATALGRR